MQEIIDFDCPTRVILHFKQDEEIAAKHSVRLVYYQAEIGGVDQPVSPCGEFIRFNFAAKNGEPVSEVNGWIRIDSIVIDSILEKRENEEWAKVSNG